MATIDDVAKLAGVSKSSVSRVLNGNFQYMSDDMKHRILTAIEDLQYSPNSLARGLKKKETQVIGIVLSDISNTFWSDVLKGVQEECNVNGYSLMVSFNEVAEMERETLLLLRNRQVDGLIVNTTGSNPKLFQDLQEEKFPFVMLDRSLDGMNVDTVIVNNLAGAEQAIQHLIDQGHRRIGILLHPLGNLSPRLERLEAYKQTLLSNGLQVSEEYIKICGLARGEGTKAMEELLSMPEPPTAVFTTNIALSLEALTGIKKFGLKVPADISVVGYDDFIWSPLLDPPLSTVAQPSYEMGVMAASLLIDRIRGKRKKSKTVQLQPSLVIRGSCAPPVR